MIWLLCIQLKDVCECRSHFTVEICHVQVLQMSVKTVLLKGRVRQDGLACRDVFFWQGLQTDEMCT